MTAGSHLHNLQKLFFSDLYTSWRVGTIFSMLFPKEHYNITTSPNRIYQLIHRWNGLAEQGNLNVGILSDGTGFKLQIQGPCCLILHQECVFEDRLESQVRKLREHFGRQPFKSIEAQTLLDRSQSQVSVLLAKAQDNGLYKRGAGRGTFYQFAA